MQVRDVTNIETSVKQSLKDLNLENFDLLLLPVQGMDKSALTVSQSGGSTAAERCRQV